MTPSHEASGQRANLDNVKKILKNLESIGSSTDQDNLKSTIISKFSKDTIRWCLWQLLGGFGSAEKASTRPQLINALGNAVTLEELDELYFNSSRNSNLSKISKPSPVAALANGTPDCRAKCTFCSGSTHKSVECGIFGSREKRREKLATLQLCFLCFSDKHKANSCSLKDAPCPYCTRLGHQKHLCVTYLKDKQTKYENKEREKSKSGYSLSKSKKGTFMETFLCLVKIGNNNYVKARGIMDTGSEISYVEESLIEKLGISKNVINRETLSTNVFGKSAPQYVISGEIALTIANLEKTLEKTLYYNTTPTTTGAIKTSPPADLVTRVLPTHLDYADSNIFSDEWEPIQILIGCNYAEYEFLLGDVIKLPVPRVILKNSIFGWIPSGELLDNFLNTNDSTTSALVCASEKEEITPNDDNGQDNALETLWSLETIAIRALEIEDANALVIEKFRETMRFENNRFIVRWPWKHVSPKIPTNYKMCVARLKSLMNSLQSPKSKIDPIEYDLLIKEQLRTGIVEIAPKNSSNATVVHYLPHRGIKKNDKLRIVYDASAKTDKNPCLNDLMHPGPDLTKNMVGLTLNFRVEDIGMIADIEKAFLQVGLHEVDRDSV